MDGTFIHCPKCHKVVLGECKCDAAPPAPHKEKKGKKEAPKP